MHCMSGAIRIYAFLLVAVAKMGTGCFSCFDKPYVRLHFLADGVISKYTTGMVNSKHVLFYIKYTWFSWNSVKLH